MTKHTQRFYKLTRPDGRTFLHNTTTAPADYRAALRAGTVIRHPTSQAVDIHDHSSFISVGMAPAHTLYVGRWPWAVFAVDVEGDAVPDPELPGAYGVLSLRVVEELSPYAPFGPHGEAVVAFCLDAARRGLGVRPMVGYGVRYVDRAPFEVLRRVLTGGRWGPELNGINTLLGNVLCPAGLAAVALMAQDDLTSSDVEKLHRAYRAAEAERWAEKTRAVSRWGTNSAAALLPRMLPEPSSPDEVRHALADHFALGAFSVHGPQHWATVERTAAQLARDSGGDVEVARWFGPFHDAARQSDGHDPAHGARAAELVERYRAVLPLSAAQIDVLKAACRDHEKGGTSSDPTIGACWDADRLDLIRVGIIPRRAYMSTDAGRRRIGTAAYGVVK